MTLRRLHLAALLSATLLAACADIGQRRPPAQLLKVTQLNPGRVLGSAGGAASTTAWPQAQWWEALHDAQLDRLVSTALSDNPNLQVAQARVRQASALAAVTQAATLPRVDATASADRELYSGHSTVPAPLAGNYAWKNSALLSGSYDLDLWGRHRAALAAALDEVQLAAAEAQMARLALESALVRTYIQLALEYTLQDSVAASLAQRQRLLEITRRRRAAGLASEIDVSSIETTLPAGRREHEQIEESIALLRNQLAALIGKGPGDGESIARPLLNLTTELGRRAALPASLPAELVGHRPDLAAQRWRVQAAAARIKVAQAEFYPNLNLTAFAGFQSLGFAQLLDTHSAMRGVAPAISLPIFDGGRLRSQLGAQDAAYDGAVEQYNATLVQALSEVANAITRIRSVQQQEQLAQRALVAARRAQALAQQAYQSGISDAQNVISAELLLLTEQQQLAQVSSRQLDNYATLMAALGGGIKLDLP